jgi:hypothetical protein
MQDLNETEKILIPTETNRGFQKVSFLTEKGLYKVLFNSNKPIAKDFQNWIYDVIKEIRLTGKYELEKKLKEKEKEIEEKDKKIKCVTDEKIFLETEKKKLQKETKKEPVIYIYQTDTRKNEKYYLKIGCTENIDERVIPYNSTHPFGKMVYFVKVKKYDLTKIEKFIHYLLKEYCIKSEVFNIELEQATHIISLFINNLNVYLIEDKEEQLSILRKKVQYELKLLYNIDSIKISTYDTSTQTDVLEDDITTSSIVNITQTEQTFIDFINNHCDVEKRYEVSTADIIGWYRIVYQNLEKEVTSALTVYLKTRFLYVRLRIQDQDKEIMGFNGIKLKEIIYTQVSTTTDEEIFIFNCCKFHPGAKTLSDNLFIEYEKWKQRVNKIYNKEEDNLKLRKFLKKTKFVLFTTIWHNNGNGQGFYGLLLNNEVSLPIVTSSTAKVVEKRDYNTGELLETWSTIAKASLNAKFSAAKMSRMLSKFTDDGTITKIVHENGKEFYYMIKK